MFTIIILAFVAICLGSFIARFVQDMRHSEGGLWARAVAAAEDSATFLWCYFILVASTLIGWADQASQFLNMPEVTNFIHTYFTDTRGAMILAGIAVITILARMRSLFFS